MSLKPMIPMLAPIALTTALCAAAFAGAGAGIKADTAAPGPTLELSAGAQMSLSLAPADVEAITIIAATRRVLVVKLSSLESMPSVEVFDESGLHAVPARMSGGTLRFSLPGAGKYQLRVRAAGTAGARLDIGSTDVLPGVRGGRLKAGGARLPPPTAGSSSHAHEKH